MSIRVCSDYCM